MSNLSVLLLKDSNAGVKQYHFGSKILTFLLILVLAGIGGMGWKFYDQSRIIAEQRQVLFEQEKSQSALQRRIDMYDGRESRISFLEDYVEELKQTAHNSDVMLKKHTALVRSSINKLDELHSFMCQTLEAECAPDRYDPANPHQTVKWLDQIHEDFQRLNQSLQAFASRRKSFEEQAHTNQQLRNHLVQTEQVLAEHMEFLKVNQSTVNRLTKKISKATGIALNKSSRITSKSTKKGRGGPTLLDHLSLEQPQLLLSSGNLRQFLYNNSDVYDLKVGQLEELSQSIEKNHTIWRQTPTLIPVRSRALSDRFGVRTDPFTRKKGFHSGLDFIAKRGTPVYAPADGIVRISKKHYGFGLFVELQHGRGFTPGKRQSIRYRTRFAHLSNIYVRRGQRVKRGDMIGRVGSTGRSTGPHLHYEVIVNGRRTDPLIPISKFNPDQRLYVR